VARGKRKEGKGKEEGGGGEGKHEVIELSGGGRGKCY